jgi:cytochrome c peroxidase
MMILSIGFGGNLFAEISSGDLPNEKDVEKARRVVINVKNIDTFEYLPGEIGPLPAVPIPADNPQTRAKIDLGKMLFFDKRLSGDNSMSCATCHDPEKGYSDGRKRSIGFGGKELGRHSPTVMNIAYNGAQFWDGRAGTMEQQAMGPIEAEVEMNLPREEMVIRLNDVPEYKKRFLGVFGEGPSLENVGRAIAAFERTIVTPNSAFDQYMRGNKQALTKQEKKGLVLFVSKAACTQCHNGVNFSDSQFHVLGVPQVGPVKEDLGRFEVTKNEKDKGAFKTPSLRNVGMSAPYMHDGAFETLDEVVAFYNNGGGVHSNKSPKMMMLNLTKRERRDLLAFLKNGLTGQLPIVMAPDLPKAK